MFSPQAAMESGEIDSPPMDVYEEGDYIYIELELPGVAKSDISVNAAGDRVIIEAVKREVNSFEQSGERVSYLQFERKFGPVKAEIDLPAACNTHEATASYQNGLLTVKLPKIKDRRACGVKIPLE